MSACGLPYSFRQLRIFFGYLICGHEHETLSQCGSIVPSAVFHNVAAISTAEGAEAVVTPVGVCLKNSACQCTQVLRPVAHLLVCAQGIGPHTFHLPCCSAGSGSGMWTVLLNLAAIKIAPLKVLRPALQLGDGGIMLYQRARARLRVLGRVGTRVQSSCGGAAELPHRARKSFCTPMSR
eukprot:1150840-Pelagomonas_calceolata.AAC.4